MEGTDGHSSRRSLLLVGGAAVVTIGLGVAAYFWRRSRSAKAVVPTEAEIVGRKGSLRELMKRGVSREEMGELEAAFEFFLEAAKQGDAIGQRRVGQMLRDGSVSTTKNMLPEMVSPQYWFALAARQGDREAQYEMANVAFHADKEKDALCWLKQAARQEHPEAMLKLGVYLKIEAGKWTDEAVGWVRKAALNNSAAARDLLEELTQKETERNQDPGAVDSD